MAEKIDYRALSNIVNPSRISYDENKHKFVRLAFDVFCPTDSNNIESLWILEDGEDGKQYLAATYAEDNQKEAVGNWNTLSNKEASLVVLYYKGFPIHKFAAAEFGFNKSDIQVFQTALVNKINSDLTFAQKVIEAQPKEKQDLLIEQFPELAKK
jgi:hypothetical protein